MPSLKPNLVKRIERLPKPTNTAAALQPLFEAISNSIHSTQAKFGGHVAQRVRIVVDIVQDRKKENTSITVDDNGLGLDDDNFEAFETTDTDNKIQIGGKGVGRLLWLDCFDKIEVTSVFKSGKAFKRRRFDFVLALEDQFKNYKVSASTEATASGFYVKFSGLRDNGYRAKFRVEAHTSYNMSSHSFCRLSSVDDARDLACMSEAKRASSPMR